MTKLFRHTILLLAAVSLVAVSCKDNAIPSDTLGTDGIQQGRVAYDTIYDMRDLDPGPNGDTIDVAEAVRLGLEMKSGETTSKSYYVLGYVKGIDTEYSQQYGNVTPVICNKTNNRKMLCYRLKGLNNKNFTSADQLKIGDVIVVYGKINNRYGKPQITQGGYVVTSSNPELYNTAQ